MNILGLKPSEIEELKRTNRTPGFKKKLLDAIESLVSSEGGRDESIFLAATHLTKAGVWDFITASELAKRVAGANDETLREFLQGVPDGFSGAVAYAVLDQRVETDRGYVESIFSDVTSSKYVRVMRAGHWVELPEARLRRHLTHMDPGAFVHVDLPGNDPFAVDIDDALELGGDAPRTRRHPLPR